ncbi:15449_t:CDS:2, partial [Cetraspora pellucida]
ARLCCNHLSKCEAFREANTEEEVKRILALPHHLYLYYSIHVNKESETNEFVNLHADSVISTVSSNSSVNSRQMIVSNMLPFTFIENEDTITVFEFLVPGLKLPKHKVIGGKVLIKSAQSL